MKPSAIVAFLALGVSALGGCSKPIDCSGGAFMGGCVPGQASAAPMAVTPEPTPASPVVGVPRPAPTPISRGEPGEFAAVDDKQCRSYGLTFGTRDYSDCRIRLSAQHRGLQ